MENDQWRFEQMPLCVVIFAAGDKVRPTVQCRQHRFLSKFAEEMTSNNLYNSNFFLKTNEQNNHQHYDNLHNGMA
ncbi:MAG: hypothetical protein ACI30Q_02575, partial [Muribaculaceae bacterium]